MVKLLVQADLSTAVIMAGVAIMLVSGGVTGHRLHRWLYYEAPAIGRRLPADIGAWVGLLVAALLLAA